MICLPFSSPAAKGVCLPKVHKTPYNIAIFARGDWGKGYGTEAQHRIDLGVYDFNPRALRVYEKLVFRREGMKRDALLWDGDYHDMITMNLLESEWSALSRSL